MCATCYAEQLQAEYLAQMCYENAIIYISKVDEVDRTIEHTSGSTVATVTNPSASGSAFDSTEDYVSVTDEQVLLLCLNTCMNVFCSLHYMLCICDSIVYFSQLYFCTSLMVN